MLESQSDYTYQADWVARNQAFASTASLHIRQRLRDFEVALRTTNLLQGSVSPSIHLVIEVRLEIIARDTDVLCKQSNLVLNPFPLYS